MRRLMAAYARALQPHPGLRSRIVAQVEGSRRQKRDGSVRWAPVAATVLTIVLVATFLLVHQSNNPRPSSSPTFTTFTTPTKDSMPSAIVAGPDRAMWFTEQSKIGRIDAAGEVTEYPLPDASAQPSSIALGADRALWFTEPGVNRIGRITTDGKITEFDVPTPRALLQSIAAGPDGNLWFTELAGNKIGRITPAGDITEFELPKRGDVQCGNVCPYGIVAGPDGALWFTESQLSAGGGNRIGRLTTDGKLTEYEIPTANAMPTCIVAGRDRLYACETAFGKLAEINLSGQISEHAVPGATGGATPVGATVGPNGAVWVLVGKQSPGAEAGGHELVRLKADGTFESFELPDLDSVRSGIVVDISGTGWLLAGNDHIIRFRE